MSSDSIWRTAERPGGTETKRLSLRRPAAREKQLIDNNKPTWPGLARPLAAASDLLTPIGCSHRGQGEREKISA